MQNPIKSDETIAVLCAKCDLAGSAASESCSQLAAQNGPRKRAKWRREHIMRCGALDRAVSELTVALYVQPFSEDFISPSMRAHAYDVQGFASRRLFVLMGGKL